METVSHIGEIADMYLYSTMGKYNKGICNNIIIE